jgi:hypothetical protein
MQLPSPPMSYATTASSRSPANQVSSGRVAVVGGMTIEPLLTVPETVVSEEVNGRYAKHGKKYGKSRKHRKHSSDEADDDRTGGKEGKGRKDGKVGQEDKKKKKEEEEFEFLEILVSTDGLCENDMTKRLTIADNDILLFLYCRPNFCELVFQHPKTHDIFDRKAEFDIST